MSKENIRYFKVIWKELKHRKVFQVALVYTIMAWGIMQVGELLFEALQVPEGAYSLLVILVLLGFPVAVVLAWAYEITPDGVRRDIVRELKHEHMDSRLTGCAGEKDGELYARIAILPFRDMAPNHDLSCFCDGLGEEIQNALCTAPGIEVIARGHCVQFVGKKIDIVKIQQELGANAIIEGSARQNGDSYRISVQLVNVGTGTNIWSHSREILLEDEFDAQIRIADEVAKRTHLTFEPEASGEVARGMQLDLGRF